MFSSFSSQEEIIWLIFVSILIMSVIVQFLNGILSSYIAFLKIHYINCKCFNRPLNRMHIKTFDRFDKHIVVIPIGRTVKSRAHAGNFFNFIVTACKLVAHLVFWKLGHMRVRVGVILNLMARVGKRLYGFGVLIYPRAYNKKCCRHIVFFKNIYKCLCVIVSPR